MSQTEHNGKLAKTFPALKHCRDNHSYNTRSAAKKLLDIYMPLIPGSMVHNHPSTTAYIP